MTSVKRACSATLTAGAAPEGPASVTRWAPGGHPEGASPSSRWRPGQRPGKPQGARKVAWDSADVHVPQATGMPLLSHCPGKLRAKSGALWQVKLATEKAEMRVESF